MSWSQLIGIKEEAIAMRVADRAKPLVECPVCGEPLDFLNGVANCRWGHFRKNGTTRGPESY